MTTRSHSAAEPAGEPAKHFSTLQTTQLPATTRVPGYVSAAGFVLSFLCLVGALFVVWYGYMVAFEDEEEPVHIFSAYLVVGLGSFLLPAIATWRQIRGPAEMRAADWVLFGFAVPYTIFWTWMTCEYLKEGTFPLALLPIVMLLGCLFAGRAFLRCVPKESPRSAGNGNGSHAPSARAFPTPSFP